MKIFERSGQRSYGWKQWIAGSVLGVCLTLAAVRPCAADSIEFYTATAAGIPVMVLSVDMNDPQVKVTGMVAQGGSGHSERMVDMTRRAHPTAAITGTYFSERTLEPIGDIVVDGRIAHHGGMGTGLCITDDNQCDFIHPPHRYARMDWSQYDFVCCAGPRLVTDGIACVYPRQEGFRDPHLLHSATRLAVGITAQNRLLFVATRNSIQLGQMGNAMKKLGCIHAINLDSGGSQGFYYNANFHIQPQRKLTNLILIYDDKQRYEKFKGRLFPGAEIARK